MRSPQAERLQELLVERGAAVNRLEQALAIRGPSSAEVGQLALEHGIVLHELLTEQPSLEDVFLLDRRHQAGVPVIDLVAAEILKLRSTRTALGLFIAAVLVSVVPAILVLSIASGEDLEQEGAAGHGPRRRHRWSRCSASSSASSA